MSSEVIHVQKLRRMAHRRMPAGRGIMGEITIRQPQAHTANNSANDVWVNGNHLRSIVAQM